ncbi:hypothetical protein GCM10010140_35530 [Streptosporangium pseudovulgare]|uniref:Uncharacterized protein n=1 Tax=Streptosporangium pseudovulgare TaxID=35765 RepID=A0ABQ2R0B3_9ACTN|nr:hypothetical protein GCM10010140_35530 [Streptosporangium pseudovulgare]
MPGGRPFPRAGCWEGSEREPHAAVAAPAGIDAGAMHLPADAYESLPTQVCGRTVPDRRRPHRVKLRPTDAFRPGIGHE